VNVTQAVAQTTARVVRTSGDGPLAPGDTPDTHVPTAGELEPTAQRVAVETWQALDANKTSSSPNAVVDVSLLAVNGAPSNEVTVTITSNCINLLPGILPTLPLTARASGPVEIFKPQGTN
jgi:hypothetical protein